MSQSLRECGYQRGWAFVVGTLMIRARNRKRNPTYVLVHRIDTPNRKVGDSSDPTYITVPNKKFTLIKDIDFCMLTTIDEQGEPHSRPMSSNGDIDPSGDLWFFTGASSHKVSEVSRLPKVNVSFADPKNQQYVSVTGVARVVRSSED